jgi:hypothetical protein
MNTERSQNPFLLVLLVVGLLSLLSFLKPGVQVWGVALRPVRLLADVLPPEAPPADLALASADTLAAVPPTPADSAAMQRASQVDNPGGLANFLAALRQTKADGSPVRIAYFGDSMIEGDLLTEELRDLLQAKFGGSGVGLVPIQSVSADFRTTIRAAASSNWRQYSLLSPRGPAPYALGVAGFVFIPRVVPKADSTASSLAGASWVSFRGGGPSKRVQRFAQVRLLYGPGRSPDQVLANANSQVRTYRLAGAGLVNMLTFAPDSAVRQMRLTFGTHSPRPVYGVSFEGRGGVTLDNFSFRGSNGMTLGKIPFEQLAAFGPALNYRLIILHYGVNITDASYQSYGFYRRAMTGVVERLQKAFPSASILIIGMSDKSSRINGEFQTNPAVPRLLAAQQQLAQQTHAAYWSLYAAMGGRNSMVNWVENKPALANRDYTHVNRRGANKMAQLLFTYLMQQYAADDRPRKLKSQ